MRESRASCGWLIVGIALAGTVGAQAPGEHAESPRAFEILSPVEGSFVSGPLVLRARVDPEASVKSVVFFVDGRQICTVTTAPFECSWDGGPRIVAHQIRVVANVAGRPREVRTIRTRGLGYTEQVDVDVVQVTATVLDEHGDYVKGLPQSAFRVFEDDRPQTITHFAFEDVPLELIVAVDISGSMLDAIPKLKVAVKEFLAAVPARHTVTLLAFNDTVFPISRAATSPADRMRGIDRLAAWGGTALYDVIARGVDMLGRRVGRKAIVVFTDGEDEGSHATLDDVEGRLQASDVTLYMIGQGRGVKLHRLKQIMDRLSRPTGGRALFTENVDALRSAFRDLLEELSQQYLLGYPPTNSVRDDTFRRITVNVDGPYHVRARQGYRAAATR